MSHRVQLAAAAVMAMVLTPMALLATIASASTASAAPKRGGSLTVILPAEPWPTLDPAYNLETSQDEPIEDSVFGGLFEPGTGGTPVPDLATGYSWSPNGLKLTITLRQGVKFQDGTPFNATAVAWNINQDLVPANACPCLTNFAAVTGVVASGKYTVIVSVSQRDTPLVSAFINNSPGYIISPTEVQTKGSGYAGQHPIGAGPFEVVSNQVSSSIVLQRYGGYWQKGHPYLSQITFTNAGSDQSAFDAISSGEAGVVIGTTTPSLIKQAETTSGLQVLHPPAIQYDFVDLNSKVPPLDNIKAREALLYASYPQQLVSVLYDNLYPITEGPEASGEQFFQGKVSTFLGTNQLAKAKQLVQQIGGLSITLNDVTGALAQNQVIEALQTQWARAGITVTLKPPAGTPAFLAQIASGNWQAFFAGYGAYSDPFLSSSNFFEPNGKYVGYASDQVTHLYAEGTELKNPADRAAVWLQLMSYLDKNVLTIPLFQTRPSVIMTKAVHGYALNQGLNPYWEDVWVS
jgi:peptide/nickel transport system substrate-binding protein